MDMQTTTPATLGIAALAEHFTYLWTAVSDDDRNRDELDAIVTTITCREPRNQDETLSLVIATYSEVETMAANAGADEADLLKRLTKALRAVARSMIRQGATSPMVPFCLTDAASSEEAGGSDDPEIW